MDDKYYTGDTFVFPFGFQNENKEPIDFEVGDILRFGMKESIYRKQYSLYKEIKITTQVAISRTERILMQLAGLKLKPL